MRLGVQQPDCAAALMALLPASADTLTGLNLGCLSRLFLPVAIESNPVLLVATRTGMVRCVDICGYPRCVEICDSRLRACFLLNCREQSQERRRFQVAVQVAKIAEMKACLKVEKTGGEGRGGRRADAGAADG